MVTGLLFGVWWGCVFGLLDFVTVWLAQPLIAVYCVLLRVVSMPFRATVRSLADPLFQSTAHALRHLARRCTQPHHSAGSYHGNQQQQQQSAAGVEWLGYV